MSGVQGMSNAAIEDGRAAAPAVRGARLRPGGRGGRSPFRLRQARHSITVGAVPDDYRTNHPIVIAEKEECSTCRSAQATAARRSQRASLEGFFAGYDKSAAPVLNIVAPSGSANDVAAADAAHDFAHIARKNGVPESRIMIASYRASPEEV